ncbi:MAG: hypothetical protein COV91_02885 [Candidatus Taylorbacteria bacterium CG11_big_fil_rev_8_21_14_0_20_46_11]|uniref:Uncharacterized protein n=1 Tax=Candidatus Taylorbacteria bacterium CG11_big_fil_rev_8_21_14_0_20_46_11 TaxID=1975025 RepID=A0A2H0KBP8_9BACT|nr:MAG: hypothetical protein COV91_02885 [Candidatus Taylorbacteria bacterium CG11_big_fil_rev_8_21_14_0_20_46_11]
MKDNKDTIRFRMMCTECAGIILAALLVIAVSAKTSGIGMGHAKILFFAFLFSLLLYGLYCWRR